MRRREVFESLDAGCDPLQRCLEELQKIQPGRLRQLIDALTLPAAAATEPDGRGATSSSLTSDATGCTNNRSTPSISSSGVVVSSYSASRDDLLAAEINQRQLVFDMARAQRSAIADSFASEREKIVAQLNEARQLRELNEMERRRALDVKYKQSLQHLRKCLRSSGAENSADDPDGEGNQAA